MRAPRGLLSKRADCATVLETLYRPEPDSRRWMRQVLDAVGDTLQGTHRLGMNVMAHEDDYAGSTILDYAFSDPVLERQLGEPAREYLTALPPAIFRALYYPGRPISTHVELEPTLPTIAVEALRGMRRSSEMHDVLGFFAYPEPGVATTMWIALEPGECASPPERQMFRRVAGHLDAAMRLRARPEAAVAAVLTPAGKFVDLADRSLGPARRAWFGDRVAEVDRSRSARRRGTFQADPWWALFQGRYSLVPREDRGGKRHYLLVVNSPDSEAHARFSDREIEIVRLAARGFTGKGVAYNMGISSSAVSDGLRLAATKLGLPSRHELLRITATMFGTRSDQLALETLTSAEREILALLRRGLSNAEIARRRARSENTVKNQIAAMLRKTRSPSRRALSLT